MKCEGCAHYRPFHGKPDSDEYECEMGMEFAYECMSNGFDKKKDRLKPCPFCNTDMSVMGQRVWHPPFDDCILYSFSFRDSEMNRQSWNRRASE